MKKILFSILLVLIAFSINAQSDSLLKWTVTYTKIADKTYKIEASTKVPEGWHLYTNNPQEDGLSTVQFATEDFENDSIISPTTFLQTSQQIADELFENRKVNILTGEVTATQTILIKGTVPAVLKGKVEAFIAKGSEFAPQSFSYEAKLEGGIAATNHQEIILKNVDLKNPAAKCGDDTNIKDTSFIKIFLLGFLGGLIALLTPCVFPMIPVTVSFFTKRSATTKGAVKNGLLYGFFILLIYVAVSIPFHLLDNVQPEILNNIATNHWLNVLFFIIFIVFSISFFGYFEITLPSSIANKTDSKGSLGSLGGIFFMALTLTIVSFSCTGPILGSLLVGTAGSGAWSLTSGLAGFGLALALPFALFAIFPNWLQKLPKSGGWLDTVKKVLAFAEVAFAFKFLSNADLVMHWGLLKREVFMAIWILVSAGLTLYSFGFLRLPHDYKGMKISTGRKILGFVALAFTIYLIPGVTNTKAANLKLLSGFAPPFSYSIYGKHNVNLNVIEANVINDYNKALAIAKEQNKPLLIDFTGWACVNCRKMEENVWTVDSVSNYIKQNFVLLSLYVDDKEKLSVEKRFTYTAKDKSVKDINTLGDLWSTFQTENFEKTAQPLYVILDNNEKLLTFPIPYTPNYKTYLEWLKCGKEQFDKSKP